MSKPLVSIWMLAYNHEKFIAKALDSVLMQKTNFDYEIVIGEDCSTDNTRRIIKEYEAKHPKVIKPIYHEKNVGGSRNAYEFTLPKCTGKYIACLEGDDYWISVNKLQSQVDFLERNPPYVASGHQSKIIYEDKSAEDQLFGSTQDETYTFTELMNHRNFHTSTLMFRRETMDKNKPIPTNILSMDRAIYLALALRGSIKYHADLLGVYRRNNSSLTSTLSYKQLETDLNIIPWMKSISKDFPAHKFKSFIHMFIYTEGVKKIPLLPLIKHYVYFSWHSFFHFPKNLSDWKWGTIFFIRRIFQRR